MICGRTTTSATGRSPTARSAFQVRRHVETAVRAFHEVSVVKGPPDLFKPFLVVSAVGPVGAILGAAVLLVDGVSEPWQFAVLAAATLALLTRRVGTVAVLVGVAVGLGGGPLPGA